MMSSKSEEVSERRVSEDSNVTSTPQKSKTNDLTPPVSSIHSEYSTHDDYDYSKSFEEAFQIVTPCTNDCCEDLKYLKKYNPQKSAKFWKTFRPKNERTLYGMIFEAPAASEVVALKLMSSYETNPKFVIMSVLKLCIDICGYQKLDINDVYKYEKCDARGAIHFLQNHILDSDLMEIRSFLMQKADSRSCSLMRTTFCNFLQRLVHLAYYFDILNDQIFAMHVFEFVRCMAFSVIKPIRYTGIIFALKLMSGCSDILSQIKKEVKRCSKEMLPDSANLMKLKQQEHLIQRYLDFFYIIFSKNCLIPDKNACNVRMECVKELIHWIFRIPEYIIFEKRSINFLKKFLQDESSDVRLCALKTCQHYINLDIHSQDMIRDVRYLSTIIEARIYDANYSVAVEACMLLIKIMKRYSRFIEGSCFKSILQLVNHPNDKLSSAAAQFVISYLQINSDSVKRLLISIAKISGTPLFKNKTSVLINALITSTPELQNWKELLSLILSDTLSTSLRKLLLKLLYEVVSRMCFPHTVEQDSVSEVDSRDLCSFIIPNAAKLLEFYDDTESKTCILKIISIIDLSEVKNEYKLSCYKIMEIAENFILQSSDNEMIKSSVTLISHMCYHFHDNRRIVVIANNVITKMHKEFQKCKEYPEDPEYITNIYDITLKLSIIFDCFDLTDFMIWIDIHRDKNFISSEYITENCVVCSKYYLIWSLKTFIKGNYSLYESQLDSELTELSTKSKEYVKICFDILESNASYSLSVMAFECICDVVYMYYYYLEGPVKCNFAFKELHIKLDQYATRLYEFFEMRILGSTFLPLKKRQEYFSKIIELLYIGLLPTRIFSDVFSVYSKHGEEYTDIFNSISEQWQKIQGFFVTIILYTLIEDYRKHISESHSTEISNKGFASLCVLAHKLSSLKILPKNLKEIINFGMNYAFRDRKNQRFLYLMKYFVQRLPEFEKTEILERFQQFTSQSGEEQVEFLYFAKVLKRQK